MRVLLFTDRKKCRSLFKGLARSRTHELRIHPVADLRNVCRKADNPVYVYLDVSGLTANAIRGRIRALEELAPGRFGIVDPDRLVKDAAELFHRGSTDYVGPGLAADRITTSRFNRVLEYADRIRVEKTVRPGGTTGAESTASESPQRWPPEVQQVANPAGLDWSNVVSGSEYGFQILFVALDHVSEMGRKSSEGLLRSLRRTLQDILVRTFGPELGRIFVWKEDSGIVLLPFDGEHLTALIPAMRLMLNRTLIDIEEFAVTTRVSWRMGLHVGSLVYRDSGGTSGIVSETLNFIFHLGDRAIRPGDLVVSWPALALVPERLRECFVRTEDFEDTALFQMRRPV